jgi:cell division protein FtsB
MWDKIKSAFTVFFTGMFSSGRGLLGAAMVAVSIYFFIGLFTGIASIQNYIRNLNATHTSTARIEAEQKKLDTINLHIKLLQEHSPDFVSEMALRHLNMGDPKSLIIKK